MKLTGQAAAFALLCILLTSGCATPPQTRELVERPPASLRQARQLEDTPFFAQDEYQCGPAALAMILVRSGIKVTPQELVGQVYVPARQGSFQVEMLAAARDRGRLALPVSPRLGTLLAWVDNGEPVLVLQNLGPDWYPVWHYAVVIGYDLAAEEILMHSGVTENYRVAMGTFERTWARSGYWGMVTLVPGQLPYRDDAQTYFQAAAALEDTHPGADLPAVWRAGMEAWPDQPDMAMGLANALYQSGEQDAAIVRYRDIQRGFPDYLPAYNNLANLLMEQGALESARQVAVKGLRIAGGDNSYLEQTLAEIRARQRNAAAE